MSDNARRILIYSHDTFGLGHLRRCRAIAHTLVDSDKNLSALILSGSPIIGSYDFRDRVDFIRIPGMIKLRNGEYTPRNLLMQSEETLALRASLILKTAELFEPDLMIVDKEPLGLRGEVEDTLKMLRRRGTPSVLGLRDVMDDPDMLASEWERKDAMRALVDLYDAVWVYGLPQICDPLEGLDVPQSVARKTVYTGYLRREVPCEGTAENAALAEDGPFILVTAGGGGDGENLFEAVLRCYEADPDQPLRSVLVFGPFMQPDQRAAFLARASVHPKLTALDFDARIEWLMDRAEAIVAMGGYNTFCEILSLDKRALIIPRTVPRREQLIRASRAAELGLCKMISEEEALDPRRMATALRHLPQQARPSDVVIPGLLDGFQNLQRLSRGILNTRGGRPTLQETAL